MLTKEYIKEVKRHGQFELEKLIKQNINNSGNIAFILENLGKIPLSFAYQWLIDLIDYDNEQVRFWVVKNLGKLKSDDVITHLEYISKNDESTIVRREAVSSIGRLRNDRAQNILLNNLSDNDPKIVNQAIRGLLIFKGEKKIDIALKELINHENEIVRNVIYKEYFTEKKKKKSVLPHAETYPFLKNVVVNGDVLEVLKYVPEESIHLTFTSPPYYNARDYSIYPSYEAYLRFLEKVFQETYRITKEGRFLIVNTSPVIIPRISRAHSSKRYPIPFDIHYFLVEMGWDFIDDIIWQKPEYSVKNRVGGFQQHRKPLAYKPNATTEYLMVYRKQTEKLIDWNIRQYSQEIVEQSKVADGFETTNVWQIHPKSDKVHSAIFPVDLCKRVIEYYSYKGDLVFDPFGGSGTLGRTAKVLGRNFFLTEKEQKYFEYMQTFKTEKGLFNENNTTFLTLDELKNTTQ